MQDFIEQLRQKFRAGRSDLFRQISWKAPARELLQAHASLIDGLLEEIYAFSCEAAGRKTSPAESSGLAIVATGGYGRRELHPFSDVDIAFIPSEEDDPWVEAVVHTAFKVVMDVFLSLRDVHVGYSFRPATEAAAWDVPTKTSLLDIRFICGTRSLADELESNIRRLLSPLDIMLECGQPDRRNGNPHRALYAVEPNLKEGPGSLRDLHRARWILKLLRGPGTNELESGLCGRAGISARQIAEVEEAADWFWRSRTWLHLAAGRLSDTLIADYQDRIAGELNGCSSQEWLSTHFARSETLARFRQTAVRMLLRGPLTVSGATLENGVLRPAGDDSRSDVALILAAQRYSIPIGLDALEHLQESRVDSLRQTEPSKKEVWAFNGIFSERAGTAAALRTLADNGLMDRFIPGFSEIMRFAPPDPAHRYTVGEHSLRMIEHLERLRYGQDPSGARFTDLLGQCSHFDMLCLAALIHDAGKIVPGRDHCESGANLAKSVAARLELAPEKSELLETLVRQHLLLVRTSRLHDLKSVSVIQRVAERVASLEALEHLYVFAYVDTCAVSEGNWTSMDVRDMEELYLKMRDFYAQSSGEDACSPGLEDRRVIIRKKLSALHPSMDESAMQTHCDAMPSSYILNTPLEEIAFHMQLLDRLASEAVVLDVYNRPGDDYSELTVCAYDDPEPGLLAKITGVLFACGVDIHKAQAFTMHGARPVVLDTLWIRCNGTQISESRARKIRTTLKDVLTGARNIGQVLEQVAKPLPAGIPLDSINLRNDLSEDHTVVHIIARDTKGLLYQMTWSLSRCGLGIHTAKIGTWNARAENNFYVTTGKGGQIPDADLPFWTARLSAILQGMSQPAS